MFLLELVSGMLSERDMTMSCVAILTLLWLSRQIWRTIVALVRVIGRDVSQGVDWICRHRIKRPNPSAAYRSREGTLLLAMVVQTRTSSTVTFDVGITVCTSASTGNIRYACRARVVDSPPHEAEEAVPPGEAAAVEVIVLVSGRL